MRNAVEQNGIGIVRTPTGIGVAFAAFPFLTNENKVVRVEVDYRGRRLKNEDLETQGPPYRDYFGSAVDHCNLAIRVKDGETVLAELGLPDQAGEKIQVYMTRPGPQVHVTESYVSVPPALTITDEVGAVWTLGEVRAAKEQSPEGEFAFKVFRDAVFTGEIASRIERRSGKIRVFTRHGWRRWLGREFS
jgi:hypothetical protein